MTVTITGGAQVRRGGVFQSAASQSAVTTTATQTLPLITDIVTLDGPTDTITNFWTLADGDEGQEMMLVYNSTGTGGGSTASGGDVHVTPANMAFMNSITFRKPNQYCRLRFMNSNWHVMERTTWEEAVDGGDGTASGGAAPVTVDAQVMTRSTGTDQAWTLADGLYEGQEYFLTAIGGTCVRTITPNSMYAHTSLSMDFTSTQGTIPRWAQLRWLQNGWHLTSPLVLTATSVSNIADAIVN
jgi:hypothetical protein